MSLFLRYSFNVCSVNRYFGLVNMIFGGLTGAFVWYIALKRAWSDCPVLIVDMCVILCGKLEYMWSIHDIGVWLTN